MIGYLLSLKKRMTTSPKFLEDLPKSNANSLYTNLKKLHLQVDSIYKDMSYCVVQSDKLESVNCLADVTLNEERELLANASITVRNSRLELMELRLLSEELDRKVKDFGVTLKACIECYKNTAHSSVSWMSILHKLLGPSEILKLFEGSTNQRRVKRRLLLPYTDQLDQEKQGVFTTISRPTKSTESLLLQAEGDLPGFPGIMATKSVSSMISTEEFNSQ